MCQLTNCPRGPPFEEAAHALVNALSPRAPSRMIANVLVDELSPRPPFRLRANASANELSPGAPFQTQQIRGLTNCPREPPFE